MTETHAVIADLHTHSTASDGTQSPAELVAAAAAAGLDVVAITDHDTTSGWDAAAAAALSRGVALVRGTEISCHDEWVSVHLLSYLHDPASPGLVAELEQARRSRESRARLMVERIAVDYPLAWSDVVARSRPGTTLGRPHIADALVDRGHVANRDEAFATILGARSPYFVGHYAPEVTATVALVRHAGGVPVFAHPAAVARGRTVPEATIEAMADAGLAGLEVDHRDHDESARRRLREVARSLGLFVTGSSDYHGAGKRNLLGENTTDPEVVARIEAAGRLAVVR